MSTNYIQSDNVFYPSESPRGALSSIDNHGCEVHRGVGLMDGIYEPSQSSYKTRSHEPLILLRSSKASQAVSEKEDEIIIIEDIDPNKPLTRADLPPLPINAVCTCIVTKKPLNEVTDSISKLFEQEPNCKVQYLTSDAAWRCTLSSGTNIVVCIYRFRTRDVAMSSSIAIEWQRMSGCRLEFMRLYLACRDELGDPADRKPRSVVVKSKFPPMVVEPLTRDNVIPEPEVMSETTSMMVASVNSPDVDEVERASKFVRGIFQNRVPRVDSDEQYVEALLSALGRLVGDARSRSALIQSMMALVQITSQEPSFLLQAQQNQLFIGLVNDFAQASNTDARILQRNCLLLQSQLQLL